MLEKYSWRQGKNGGRERKKGFCIVWWVSLFLSLFPHYSPALSSRFGSSLLCGFFLLFYIAIYCWKIKALELDGQFFLSLLLLCTRLFLSLSLSLCLKMSCQCDALAVEKIAAAKGQIRKVSDWVLLVDFMSTNLRPMIEYRRRHIEIWRMFFWMSMKMHFLVGFVFFKQQLPLIGLFRLSRKRYGSPLFNAYVMISSACKYPLPIVPAVTATIASLGSCSSRHSNRLREGHLFKVLIAQFLRRNNG